MAPVKEFFILYLPFWNLSWYPFVGDIDVWLLLGLLPTFFYISLAVVFPFRSAILRAVVGKWGTKNYVLLERWIVSAISSKTMSLFRSDVNSHKI